MGDLISRSALIGKLKKRAKRHEEDAEELKYENFSCDMDELLLRLSDEVGEIIEVIEQQPTVDAKTVVHGEWIKKVRNNGGYIASITCSACGYSHSRVTYNFCPECGADMRKDGANDV